MECRCAKNDRAAQPTLTTGRAALIREGQLEAGRPRGERPQARENLVRGQRGGEWRDLMRGWLREWLECNDLTRSSRREWLEFRDPTRVWSGQRCS